MAARVRFPTPSTWRRMIMLIRHCFSSPSKAKIWAQHQDLHGDSVKLDIPHPSSWVVVYQIWSLESMECTWKSRFYLPEKKVLSPGNPRLSAYGYGGSLSEEFRFPVAFSPSLRLAFIMGVIIQVGKTSQTGATSVQKHLLFDPRCPFGHQDDTMLARLNRPQYFNGARLRAFELMRGPRDLSNHPFHTWYRCYFSPLERYAIIIKGGCAPDEIRFEAAWVIDVHERIDDHSPVFQLIATTGIRLNGAASHSVVCHPHRAVLAISMPALTVLWRFGHKGKSELLAQIQTNQLTAYRRWVHYSFQLSSDANAIFQLWKLSLRPRSKT